ncbi:MAG TPA: dockerin type I domain-containing protein [Bryobacteraceae bacterium]|nr:dockerin type I domain-containing protein [Bryobacteraceae bacterium]
MRILLLAILIGSPACAQTLNGLGSSSKTCVDLDGDGYGTGPSANLMTTAFAAVGPGLQTVQIGATTGLVVGQRVRYDTGANLEFVTLTAVSGGTITGNFIAAHAAGVSVSAGTHGDGSLFFPGYPADDPGCLGLDADDRDATVQTAAQGIAKYGSLNAFLAKLGRDIQTYEADSVAGQAEATAVGALLYSPAHIYYLSPSGADGGGCGTSAASPCLTVSGLVKYAGYTNTGVGGDLILLRNGWNGRLTFYSGSATRFNGAMSYPGEHAIVDASTNGGYQVILQQTNCATPDGANYIFLDGFRIRNGATIAGGTIDTSVCPSQTASDDHDVWIQHIDGTEGGSQGLSPISGFNGITNWMVEYSALHDDNCSSNCNTPHGLYLGSHSIASSNTTIRRNLIYRNSWNGLHWNGNATGLFIDQNVVYDNGITGLDFEEGLAHSFIRGNLVFNNVKQMVFYNYAGSCQSQGTYNGQFQLCPGNQNYNLIENNTLYMTGNADVSYPGSNPDAGCPTGYPHCAQPPIQISNASSPLEGDLGSNTFRNNIIVAYGWNDAKPGVAFGDPTASGTCGSVCQGWAQTSTFDHNLFWQSDGKGGASVLLMAATKYTCATAGSVTAAFTNCTVADPEFVAENIANWNVESSFDLRLSTTSPALHAGSTAGVPDYDAAGRAYTESGPSSAPSLGALERNLYAQGWTTLTGAGLSPAVAPNTGDPNNTNCLTQSGLDASPCPPNGYPFPTKYTSEFTAWTDGIKREKPGSPKQLVWFGGGHADYIGNEIYAISLNRVAPSIARIFGPSTFAAPGLTVLQTWLVLDTNPQPALADGSASTRHTPGNLAYNLTADKMGLFGGAIAGGNGAHTYDSWEFDFGTNAWQRYNSGGANTHDVDCSNHGSGYSGCGLAVGQQVDPIASFNGSFQGSNVYDPLTQSYWVYWGAAGGYSVLTQYYPTYHQHVVRAMNQPSLSGGAIGGENSRVFISDRRWIFVTDWYNNTLRSWIIDISGATSQTPSSGPNPSMAPVTTDASCNGLLETPGPGLVYLPLQGRILGYPAGTGGNTYYLMDPATWTCTTGTFAGGPATNPLNQYIIGKMQHFDSLDVTLVVNDVGANAPAVLNLSPGDPGGGSIQPSTGGGGGGAGGTGTGTTPTCDLNGDGSVNVVDVQIAINQALGIAVCSTADLQQNGQCNAVDVQRLINAALGGACATGP